MRPAFDGLLDGDPQVVDVVQRVEDADDVDAVAHGSPHETAHHVVGIVGVS